MLSFTSALLALASAQVNLVVESSDSSLSGKGVSNIHFGAAINGALISDSLVSYDVDGNNDVYTTITISGGEEVPLMLQSMFGDLVAAAENSTSNAKIIDSYLAINGSSEVFYACDKLAWDPYSYTSASNKGVGVYSSNAPSGCTPIKIKTEALASNTTANATAAASTISASNTTAAATSALISNGSNKSAIGVAAVLAAALLCI